MSVKSEILRRQRDWATQVGLAHDDRGYLDSYEKNLFQSLNPKSKQAFDQGSGLELRDRSTGPAKMRALHSSSALAVNFFDFWVNKDTDPLKEIFGLQSKPCSLLFEGQYPTGLPGNPPNLDVVLGLQDGTIVGIESKFTEWLTPKSANKPAFKEKYFQSGIGIWEKVGLPETQRFAADIQSRKIEFRHLDAPQLMKHALGLATHCGQKFKLLYVYFGSSGREAEDHQKEIGGFKERLKSELGFDAFSYQELIVRLESIVGAPAPYLEYLRTRYA